MDEAAIFQDLKQSNTQTILHGTLLDVANTALQVLGADMVDLYEYDADIGAFSLPPIMLGTRLVSGAIPRVIRSDDLVMKIVRDGLEIFASDARDTSLFVEDWGHERHHLPQDRFVIRENIVSTAAVAIRVESEVVGVLFVGYRSPRDFDSESELRDRVRSFAGFAGNAIQNARLLERVEALGQQADALAEIGAVVNRREGLVEVGEQMLDSIRSVVPYVRATFHVVNGDQRTLVAARGFDRFRMDPFLSRSISDDPLISRVMSQPDPLILRYCKRDPDWQIHPDTEGVESWIGLRLSNGTETLGLLTLEHDVAGFYRPQMAAVLTAFGNQAAIAIRMARSIGEIEDRSKRFERLQKVAQAIAAETSDLQRVLQLIVDELAESYPQASCAIRLYDPGTGQFEPQVATGTLSDMLADQPEPEGNSRYVIMTGEPRFLSERELIDPPDGGPPIKYEVRERGVEATAYLPLKVEGEIQGVLNLDIETHYAFSDPDREFLRLFSDQAAVAIRNARLIERQRREREERIRAIKEIGFGISTDVTLQEVLDGLLDKTLNLFGKASEGQLYLVDETNTKLRVVSVRGEVAGPVYEIEIGQGIPGWVAKTGMPGVYHDVAQEMDYVAHLVHTQSEIAVPLLRGGPGPVQVIGVLNVEHSEKHAFSEDDIPLLQAIATQAVVAIDNARLFEELHLRAERLEKIQRISLELSGEESDLNQIMRIAVEGLTQIFPGSSCSIRLRDPETGEYGRLVAAGRLKGRAGKPRKEGPTAYVLSSREPLYIDDTADTAAARRDDKLTIKKRVRDLGIRAIGYLPLISQGQVLGVLYLNLDHPHRFAHDERRLLELFASQAAAAVDNAKLIQHIQQDLHATIKQLEVLTEIYEKIIEAGIDNLDRILDIVYEETSKIIDVSDALFYIALYDEQTEQVTFGLAIEKNDGKKIEEIRWGKSAGKEDPAWMPRSRQEPPRLTEYVINQKTAVLIPSQFSRNARKLGISFWPRIGKGNEGKGRPTRSWLGVPLMINQRVTGVISIQNLEREHALDDKHKWLLEKLAAEAAVALDSAQLYKIARQDAIAAKQLATLGVAIAALEHRINNSFSIIIPNVSRLRKKVDVADPEIVAILDLIERNARDTATMIDRIQKPLREIEAQWVDVNAVINEVIEAYVQTQPRVAFERLLAAQVPLIHVSIGQITEVVRNLVQNACSAMNGAGAVRVSSRVDDNNLQIRIEDTGPGIPLDIQKRLFIRPVASKGSERSSGLGLWLSQLILQSLNGSIRIERSDSTGTVMLVEIPVKYSTGTYS